MEKQNIIPDYQFGFREKHGTLDHTLIGLYKINTHNISGVRNQVRNPD